MADNFQPSASKELYLSSLSRCVLVKWKVAASQKVSKGSILAVYKEVRGENHKESDVFVLPKLKSDTGGLVKRLLVAEGERVSPGQPVILLEVCKHTTIMKDMCADCGMDLRCEPGIPGNLKEPVSASVALVHNIPELRVSKEEAEVLGKNDKEVLLKNKKLVLLVDLDQTLIHTTNENVPPDMKDVYHFQLYGQHIWYHTKFRPGWKSFLEDMSKYYELHIFTMGSRMYAHTIARMLDPTGELFADRIRSRDESFDMYSKYRDLRILFPCDDSMVCIIDDREDIWDCAPNLVTVKPYRFFHGTGDINSPFGPEQAFTHPSVIPMHEDPEVRDADLKPNATRVDQDGPEQVAPRSEEKSDAEMEPAYAEEAPSRLLDPDAESSSKNGKENIEVVDKEERSVIVEATEEHSLSENTNHISATESPPDQVEDDCEFSGNNGEVDADCKVRACGKEEETRNCYGVAELNKKSDVPNEAMDTQIHVDLGETGAVPELPDEDEKGVSENDPTKDCDTTKDVPEPQEQSEVLYNSSNNVEVKETERHDGDSDDYLLYLEDILRRIHARFYETANKPETTDACPGEKPQPDLRYIMPELRQTVLKGANVVFTGVIPTNCEPEDSQVWRVASQFGANVTKDMMMRKNTIDRRKRTTHVVAARPGTEKACQALRLPNVKLVNPNWLWTCAERWELVDERLFPVEDYEKYKARKRETPPTSRPTKEDLGNSSTDIYTKNNSESRSPLTPRDDPGSSGEFTEVMNPFLSFSSGEMEEMDKEVEDLMRSSEDEGDEILGSVSSSSSSTETESTGSFQILGVPKGKTVNFSTIKQTLHQHEMPITKRCKLDFGDETEPPKKMLKTDENIVSDVEGGFSNCEESAESGSSDEEGGSEMAAMLEAAIFS